MSRQFTSLLTLPLVTTGAVAAERFVTHLGAQAGAAANALGVARTAATASGQTIVVDAVGTAAVEAGAAVAQGDLIQTDASGRAITRTSTNPIVGRALQAATAAGDFIEVLLIAN